MAIPSFSNNGQGSTKREKSSSPSLKEKLPIMKREKIIGNESGERSNAERSKSQKKSAERESLSCWKRRKF